MATKRRHKFTMEEWHQIFKKAVEYCRERKKEERFQDCMSRVLKEAYKEGKWPYD